MKRARAKVSALLKESRRSLHAVRRMRKKLRALRKHIEEEVAATKKAASKKKAGKRR